ncbi:MAG: glycosyltransferase family A protein [Blastocatellia bacterium]|nr:glycosyltransferase family A protein [Blastocatellia bacterium]
MTTNTSPRISIIIPAYNTSQYIGEALDSVFAQSFTDYEVIVINDGSPDTPELERVLEPYQPRIRYLKKENGGLASARNAGLRVSRGEIIVMLDSDDYWLPDYLEKQVASLTSAPDVAVSYTNAMLFGDSPLAGKDFMTLFPSEGDVTFASMLEEKVHVMGTCMVKREVIFDMGLYDETLRASEDFDLWLRVAHKGWKIVYLREPLFMYRRRAGCLSEDQAFFWKNVGKVFDKIERTMELAPRERRVFEERRRFMRARLALYEGKQAFFAGDTKTAISSLTEANNYIKSPKLSVAVGVLRVAPRLALSLYEARDRFIYKKDTKA